MDTKQINTILTKYVTNTDVLVTIVFSVISTAMAITTLRQPNEIKVFSASLATPRPMKRMSDTAVITIPVSTLATSKFLCSFLYTPSCKTIKKATLF